MDIPKSHSMSSSKHSDNDARHSQPSTEETALCISTSEVNASVASHSLPFLCMYPCTPSIHITAHVEIQHKLSGTERIVLSSSHHKKLSHNLQSRFRSPILSHPSQRTKCSLRKHAEVFILSQVVKPPLTQHIVLALGRPEIRRHRCPFLLQLLFGVPLTGKRRIE